MLYEPWSTTLSMLPAPARGRAPDVFKSGGWVPMHEYRDDEAVDFAIVGTGAGGGTLAARLAEKGFSVVAFDAGPFFRPLDDFASDETEQEKLYWKDNRIVEGNDWMIKGGKNSGKAVGRLDRSFRHGVATLPTRMCSRPARCSAMGPTGR